MNNIKILIADDHPIFRHGLHLVIEAEPNLRVVGEAENGRVALDLVENCNPDVFILDVDMPVLDGIETAKEMYANFPATKVLFLTLHREKQILDALETMNVRGYVLKDSALLEIVECINRVVAGDIYISPQISIPVYPGETSSEPSHDLGRLTTAEATILRYIADSMTSREIAETLFISVRTVENHRFNICAKLGIRGNNSLLKFALENRLAIYRSLKYDDPS